MTRREDLEENVRQSYQLIREYEDILRLSADPREKARARRAIEEQWALIEGYLNEHLPLCRSLATPIPPDIAEIAARFHEKSDRLTPPAPATSGSTYTIHINHTEETVTGDGAQVVQPPTGERTGGSLERALRMARRTLAILEEQAAGYTALTIPAHLRIELEEQRRKVAELKKAMEEERAC